MSDFKSFSSSNEEAQFGESGRAGIDTGLKLVCFAAGCSMISTICCSILVATHSTEIVSILLRWMNAAIDAMDNLVKCSFLKALSAALLELK